MWRRPGISLRQARRCRYDDGLSARRLPRHVARPRGLTAPPLVRHTAGCLSKILRARPAKGAGMNDIAVSILSDIDCHLGEGPSYDPLVDTLFWFDIVGCRLFEKPWPKGETTAHDL